MKRNSLVKRMLVFSLSAMMAAGLVPGTAYAAASEETATVSAKEMSEIPKITSFQFDGKAELDLTKGQEASLPATIQMNWQDMDGVSVEFTSESGNDWFTLYFNRNSGTWSSPVLEASGAHSSGIYRPSYVTVWRGEEWYQFSRYNVFAPIPKVLRDCEVNVKATGEQESPSQQPELQVTAISVSKSEFNGPITDTVNDTVNVTFKGKPEYNLEYANVVFYNKEGGSNFSVNLQWDGNATRRFDANGCYTAEIPLTALNEYMKNGTYEVSYIGATISVPEKNQRFGHWDIDNDWEHWETLQKPTVTITGNQEDTAAPVLKELRVDKTRIKGGGILHFTADIVDDKSGLDESVYMNFTRADGQTQGINLEYDQTKKCFEGSAFVSDEAVDGIYQMMYFQVRDKAGNELYYHEDTIPEEFRIVLTVENGVEEEIKEEVTEENVSQYLSYEAPALEYNGDDQSDDVKKAVSVTEEYTEKFSTDDVELLFRKQDSNDEFQNDIVDAGNYDVYASVNAYEIKTKAPVKLGTAVVDKHTVTLEDIYVEDTVRPYERGGWEVEHNLKNWWLRWENIKIVYKDENGQELEEGSTDDGGHPMNVGTYKVYVSYEEDDNCTALAETDTGKKLTITKADVASEYTFDSYVINNQDSWQAGYELQGYIDDWMLDGKDHLDNVSATVSVKDDADKKYLTDISFGDYDIYGENGEVIDTVKAVKFNLTDEAKQVTENKTILLHVDFGDSFTNWTAEIDLPIVITPKKALWMWLAEDQRFIYDGNEKPLIFEVRGDEEFGAISGSAVKINEKDPEQDPFTVKITKDGETVSALKEAGRYIVSAVYDDGTYYGEMTWGGWVEPKRVDSLEGLLKLNRDTLVYNGYDQTVAIHNAIAVEDGIAISKEDFDAYIDCEGPATEVGTYDVYASCDWENDKTKNYEWDGDLKIGTITIAKLSVSADSKGSVTIKVGDKAISNTDPHVTLEYYKGSEKLQSAPTAPGTYKVKVAYTDDTYLHEPVTAEAEYTIPSQTTPSDPGSGSGSSGAGGSGNAGGSGTGSAATPSTGDKKDDGKAESKPVTVTKEDGTQVTTTETKAEDGTVQAKVELKNEKTGVEATVNVTKDADGKVTEATAAVTQTSEDKKAGISADAIAQITEAAGTKDIEVTTKIVDANGKTVCKLTVNAEDLKAGNQMKVLKIDSKTGKMSLVNKSTYKVDKDGNIAMDDLKKASYMVLTKSEADAFSKAVLKTVKVETAKKNVTEGKKTKITLDDGLDMNNVAKITYKTSKKSVATVNKNGTITAKKAGKVTVKATVTLKNGKTKTVKMTITVKNAK